MAEHGEPASDNPTEWLTGLSRAILDSALDCIVTMDAGGMIREFNPAAERVFGYTRKEAVGRELAELIVPPSLRERHRQGLAHFLKTGEGPVLGRRIEIAAVRADGEEILVELAITAYQIAGQSVFTAYLRDITERVRSERRRTAQYHVASLLASSLSILEVGPEIIQTIAAIGDWVVGSVWLCENNCETLRCSSTWHGVEPCLNPFTETTSATSLAPATGLPGRVVESHVPTWVSDVTQDENFLRHAAAAAAGLRGGFAFPLSAHGKVNGVLELFGPEKAQPDEDLLDLVKALGSEIGLFIHRQQIEEELQRQKEAAEAANAAKDRFLANLSHELRTPLTPVLIWAGGMKDSTDLSPEIAEGLSMISRNVELEARLIDDLLDLTRITRGKLELRARPCDVHELLRHAIEIVRNDIEARALILEVSLEAMDHMVLADPARLQQVFWNVLRNATKFTDQRGTISVHTSNETAGEISIRISDTGIGIEPESIGKIFDAFEQVSSRREGLGLGLAISKAVIEAHGGTMKAASAGAGRGPSFIVGLTTTSA
ncbi:MAG: PAS domain S-box protein [Chthoniobacterales bacterium]